MTLSLVINNFNAEKISFDRILGSFYGYSLTVAKQNEIIIIKYIININDCILNDSII